MAIYIIVAVVAYLLGSISLSVIISKKMAGFDVREKGSKSTGTTNMLRSVGKRAALLTFLWDVLKGVLAVVVAVIAGNIAKNADRALLVQIAGIMVVIGHTFPIFLGFKGGKGVATSFGVILVINWQIALICMVFALVIMAITKIVSVGSIGVAILFPILVLFINANYTVESSGLNYFVFSLILAFIVIFNHRENIKRIANGNENKLNFKKESK